MDVESIIENISKKSKVPIEELKKEYEQVLGTLPDSPDKEKQALKQVNNKHVGGANDKTEDFDIVVIGVRRVVDFNAKVVEEAISAYHKDPQSTLESGRVQLLPMDPNNPNGEKEPRAIDTKKSFPYDGKDVPNSNYGKPLLPKYNSDCVVLARKNSSDKWQVTKLALRENHAQSFDTNLMFTPVSANLLGKIDEKGLKTGKSSKFTAFEIPDFNMNNILNEVCADHVMMLGDVFKYTEGLDQKDYDRYVITGGTVQSMYPPKTAGNSANGLIDDLTSDQLESVFIDPRLRLPEEGQEYTFVCSPTIRPRKDKDKNPTGENQLTLNVLGYY